MSKNILKSKTFWLNAIGIAQLVSGVIPVDPATSGLILAGLNIVNRKLTNSPVTILPKE